MRDKRPVDELSIEELERILAIRKREARQKAKEHMTRAGRAVPQQETPAAPAVPPPPAAMRVPALEALLEQAASAEAPPASLRPAPAGPALSFEDTAAAAPPAPRARRRRSPWADRVLIAIEAAAVIGLVVIGANLFGAVRSLERETASAQALADEQRRLGVPTIAPTPSLRMESYVLPGGHTISDSGSVEFNYNEVPSHLLPLVESQWIRPVAARPQATDETALALVVPALNLNQTIVQGVDWEALKQGVGQLVNGVDPGDDVGNLVLAAHNDVYGETFRYLDQLSAGDNFQIQTRSTVYTYVVTDVLFVDPDDVDVLANRSGATATLISCYPYRVNTQRIVVFADRIT